MRPKSFLPRMRQRVSQGVGMWAMCISLAFAVVVTAEQVAAAVANSAYGNAFLRTNASAVGALAMFESGGETTIYNGSCCYGVLQMSTSNIRAAGYTPAQYAALPLQAQVDAWVQMQAHALSSPVVAQLQAMGTFNGQPVDFPFLLACVQLGRGNCATMVATGSCSGFSDRNGTTICGMAARTRANLGLPAAPGDSASPGLSVALMPTVNGYSYGSHNEAYQSVAGSDMQTTSNAIRSIILAITLLLAAIAFIAHFGGYAAGDMPVLVFIRENKRVVMFAVLVMVVLLGGGVA
jgi:hypothetical protein